MFFSEAKLPGPITPTRVNSTIVSMYKYYTRVIRREVSSRDGKILRERSFQFTYRNTRRGKKNPAKNGFRVFGRNCVANPRTVEANF